MVLKSDVGGSAPSRVAGAVGFVQRFKRYTHLKLFGELLGVGQRERGLGVVQHSSGALGAEFGALFVRTGLKALDSEAPCGGSALDFAGGKDGALLEAASTGHGGKDDAGCFSSGQARGVVAKTSGVTAQDATY